MTDRQIVDKYLPEWYKSEIPDNEIDNVHILAAKFIQLSEGYSYGDINGAYEAIAKPIIRDRSTFRFE